MRYCGLPKSFIASGFTEETWSRLCFYAIAAIYCFPMGKSRSKAKDLLREIIMGINDLKR